MLLLLALLGFMLLPLPAAAVPERPAAEAAPPARTGGPSGTLVFDDLDAAAFPDEDGHPDALVYLPGGFDPGRPISLIVYLHGYENCIENVARDVGQPCTPGGAARVPHGLLKQIEASGKNAILLCPELAFDQRSGDPGNLGTPAGFRALIDEVLGRLRDRLGRPMTTEDLGRVVLIAHSAGFEAAAAILRQGWVRVDEVFLLDALYANAEDFESWVTAGVRRRLVNIYTRDGGTWKFSRGLLRRLVRELGREQVLDDRLPAAELTTQKLRRRVVFKRTDVAHESVPRAFVADLLRTSGLSPSPAQHDRPVHPTRASAASRARRAQQARVPTRRGG